METSVGSVDLTLNLRVDMDKGFLVLFTEMVVGNTYLFDLLKISDWIIGHVVLFEFNLIRFATSCLKQDHRCNAFKLRKPSITSREEGENVYI